MDSGIESRNALVTGASTGIGRGIAFALAESGYNLVISHLNEPEKAEEVARAVREQHGRRCHVVQGDLSQNDTPAKLAQEAIDFLGDVHVLVNNAGVTIMSPIVDMDPDKMEYLFRLNYRAPLMLMQAIGRHMIERKIRGSMINTASSRGERAYPADAVYGGLKAALIRSTQSIALELSTYGIRVNCIAPGAIAVRDTLAELYKTLGDKIPLGRMGTPEDIGNAAVWLASEASSYITGTTLRIDGGLILPGMPERTDAGASHGWGRINYKG